MMAGGIKRQRLAAYAPSELIAIGSVQQLSPMAPSFGELIAGVTYPMMLSSLAALLHYSGSCYPKRESMIPKATVATH